MQDLAALLQCLILRKQQPEAALQQLDELAGRHIETLRNLTRSIQDVRTRRDNDGIRAAIQQYDNALERYVPGKCSIAAQALATICHLPGAAPGRWTVIVVEPDVIMTDDQVAK